LTPTALRSVLARLALAGLLILAGCGGGANITPLPSGAEPPADCARVADGVITLSAKNIKFSAPCLVANAGEAFTIRFTNEEAVPHDVAVYTDSSTTNEIMRGDPITGPNKTIDYHVEGLSAGEYFFHCTIHPAMNGALYVVAPAS
jgi:plastocyanin